MAISSRILLGWIYPVLLCLLASQAFAQESYKFRRLNEEQNLTNLVIHDIVQDTLGFVWVGTEDGLFRFDGTEFHPFRSSSERKALPNNTINALHIDRSNQLWILTNLGPRGL